MFISSCSNSVSYDTDSFFAADTFISIYAGKGGQGSGNDCRALISDLENKLSKTIGTSEVYRFNESESGITDASEDTVSLVELSKELYSSTDGAFDITLEPLISLWDITGGEDIVPDNADISSALSLRGADAITADGSTLIKSEPGIRIDLGGIAKGYMCRRCVEHLRGSVAYGMVDIGGNIGVFGNKPNGEKWKIAIKDPFDTNASIGYLTVEGGYVAVSGDYERYFEKDGKRYHHLFDPETGYPADNGIHEVAVYTKENGELGDGLSSALFIMGVERSLELYETDEYEFEALFVTDDGIIMTNGMKDLFTPSEE